MRLFTKLRAKACTAIGMRVRAMVLDIINNDYEVHEFIYGHADTTLRGDTGKQIVEEHIKRLVQEPDFDQVITDKVNEAIKSKVR